jgi:hypothetical protein
MPANLPPQFIEARNRLSTTKDPQKKIKILEEMLSIIPKHKGTEKIQAELKSKLSKLKAKPLKKSPSTRKEPFFIEREGAGQVVVIGSPNSGKSLLLQRLTNATPIVAPYPYTTRDPLPGMMVFENIQIQLVDTPPISSEYMEPWISVIIRGADGVLVVLDLSESNCLKEFETIQRRLSEKGIHLIGERGGGESGVCKRALLLLNKCDLPSTDSTYQAFTKCFSNFRALRLSIKSGEGLEGLRGEIFKMLNVIRVYTKTPGGQPDYKAPVVLPFGSTVRDVASSIHKDFVEKLRYAKIYTKSKKGSIKTHGNHPLVDGDIVELHV